MLPRAESGQGGHSVPVYLCPSDPSDVPNPETLVTLVILRLAISSKVQGAFSAGPLFQNTACGHASQGKVAVLFFFQETGSHSVTESVLEFI